jgi:AAHS family 4-hydroxybenzoate transporter-like MFS transporter
MVLAIYALIGIASAAVLAMAHTNHLLVQALIIVMGFVVLASQLGLNAVVGMLYPTAVRSIGTGFCHSIGRIGAIGGPLIAGLLMAGHVDSFRFFIIPIVPLAVALVSILLVTRLWIGKVLTPEKMRKHLV